mmetsp:Transcript_101221/g.314853  ORF Transcript_101221/g.314853 Transcript_101221/m.314853 type:complete len:200 (-) Transcript_101221:4-603(-)
MPEHPCAGDGSHAAGLARVLQVQDCQPVAARYVHVGEVAAHLRDHAAVVGEGARADEVADAGRPGPVRQVHDGDPVAAHDVEDAFRVEDQRHAASEAHDVGTDEAADALRSSRIRNVHDGEAVVASDVQQVAVGQHHRSAHSRRRATFAHANAGCQRAGVDVLHESFVFGRASTAHAESAGVQDCRDSMPPPPQMTTAM